MASKPKQKPLLPVLKEKKRYLTYQLYGEGLPANAGHLLIEELKTILGVFHAAEAGLLPIAYDHDAKRGVFKTSLVAVRKARIGLMLISMIKNQRVHAHPLITSGILRKAKQAM